MRRADAGVSMIEVFQRGGVEVGAAAASSHPWFRLMSTVNQMLVALMQIAFGSLASAWRSGAQPARHKATTAAGSTRITTLRPG